MTGWNPAKVWTDHRCWVVIAGKRISRIVENGKICYNFDEFRLHWCVLHLQVFEPKESKNEETKGKKEIPPTLIRSCQQIVNGLVNSVMDLEKTNGPRLVGCITALHSFAQIRPHLLVEHAISLEPYLNIKCTSNERIKFISLLAEILEHVRSSFIDRWIAVNLVCLQVVPLMEHPGEAFLSELEAHLMMLIVTSRQIVVVSCVACLGAVINKITKNYQLVRDCFTK